MNTDFFADMPQEEPTLKTTREITTRDRRPVAAEIKWRSARYPDLHWYMTASIDGGSVYLREQVDGKKTSIQIGENRAEARQILTELLDMMREIP